jgi:hemoglobin
MARAGQGNVTDDPHARPAPAGARPPIANPAAGRGQPVPVPAVGGARPAPARGSNPHFERIGGMMAVDRLVRAFYNAMESEPLARDIRALHPADLTRSREKLFAFLVGWLGGPPLYVASNERPHLRLRHQPFAIGTAERDAWLRCMDLALEEVIAEAPLRAELRQAFARTADSLRNR